MAGSNITQNTIKDTGYCLIVLTTIILACRFAKFVGRLKELKAEDYLLLVAYVFFLELTILYIIITPAVFRTEAVARGEIPPYPTIMEDALQVQTFFFVTTSSLWLSLWMVKFSLLSLYKRLLVGQAYIIAWWTTMAFCVAVLIGAIISSWLSCSSFKAWFTAGACNSDRDHRAAAISLYYSFAVDLVSDLMIMILPLRLIWNLQMNVTQKVGIGGLFCIGWVCIIVAIIRVVELGNNYSVNDTPAPTWLALWAIVEASIAVIIGCCPGLYRAVKVRLRRGEPSYRYDSYTFNQQLGSNTPSHRFQVSSGRDIPLSRVSGKPMTRTSTVAGNSRTGYWNDATSSQEKLANRPSDENAIMFTQRVSITVHERDSLPGV